MYCVALLLDTTDFSVEKSADALHQQSTYSGKRGKNHAFLQGTITDCAGSVVAAMPGLSISATPRGGDSVSTAVQLNRWSGVKRLLRGTPNIGVALVVDLGYIFVPHNVNMDSYETLQEFAGNNDILLIYRSKEGDYAFHYNPTTELEIMYDAATITTAANAGRLATLLRRAIENFHLFKQIYQSFQGLINHCRFDAIGPAMLRKYNNKYHKRFPDYWAMQCILYIEYLVAVGHYNLLHPKFFSRQPEAMQLGNCREDCLPCGDTQYNPGQQHQVGR